MKTERNAIKSMRARYNQMSRHVDDLKTILQTGTADDLTPEMLAEMRSLVEDINQCQHELNAYWNAVNT